jgi:hypothetical protein
MVSPIMRRLFFVVLLLLVPVRLAADGAGEQLLTGAPEPLAGALRAFGVERERWAYTERFSSTDRHGDSRSTRLLRFDPSRAPEERWTLLEEDGRPPTERAQRKFRREMAKVRRIRLSEYLQLDRAVVRHETAAEMIYEVPLRAENNDRLPPDKFEVRITLQRAGDWHLAAVDVTLREPMRMALVAKVRQAGAGIRLERVSPEHGPVVRSLRGAGEGTVVFVKVGGAFMADRSDFKRVTPYDERFGVKLAPLQLLDF